MIYITGDTHGKFERIEQFCLSHKTSKKDILIILGDAGINYAGEYFDYFNKQYLESMPIKIFAIHGNHEQRPETIDTYITKSFNGGIVYFEPKFPSLLFAKDGEIYNLCGVKTFVVGGAYSVDKEYRLQNGYGWWKDEQPSEEVKTLIEKNLSQNNWNVDVMLTHTIPLKYEPTEVFLKGIDQSKVDKSTEEWLDSIEYRLTYKKWYCGHYHTEKKIDKIQFMFTSIEKFEIV